MLTRRDFLKTTLSATGAAFLPQISLPGRVYPYIQNLCRGRASVVWQSPAEGGGTVELTDSQGATSSVVAAMRELLPQETGLADTVWLYRADLGNLRTSADYRYRIFQDDSLLTRGDEFRFRTGGAGEFNFLAFGDCGMGNTRQETLARRMNGENAALALITGDLVYMDGSYAEYERNYFPIYANMMRRMPFFPCPGNHDYHTQNLGPYLALNAVPTEDVPVYERGRYYSFDWGNVHFVSLDTNTPLRAASRGAGKMLEWLDNDLGKSKHFWRVVYFHHPPYASGIHDSRVPPDPLLELCRNHIVPILDRHKVELVFTGHEHSYQRTYPIRDGKYSESGEGTVYITTGGGGGHLYPVINKPRMASLASAHHYVRTEVQGASMTVRAIRIDGAEIDRFTLAPLPVVCASFLSSRDTMKPLAWGSPVVSIYGKYLASEEKQATTEPFPRTLNGTTVTLQGRALPLLSVSPTKIEVQIPQLRQWARLRVETQNGSVVTDVEFSEQPDYQLCK